MSATRCLRRRLSRPRPRPTPDHRCDRRNGGRRTARPLSCCERVLAAVPMIAKVGVVVRGLAGGLGEAARPSRVAGCGRLGSRRASADVKTSQRVSFLSSGFRLPQELFVVVFAVELCVRMALTFACEVAKELGTLRQPKSATAVVASLAAFRAGPLIGLGGVGVHFVGRCIAPLASKHVVTLRLERRRGRWSEERLRKGRHRGERVVLLVPPLLLLLVQLLLLLLLLQPVLLLLLLGGALRPLLLVLPLVRRLSVMLLLLLLPWTRLRLLHGRVGEAWLHGGRGVWVGNPVPLRKSVWRCLVQRQTSRRARGVQSATRVCRPGRAQRRLGGQVVSWARRGAGLRLGAERRGARRGVVRVHG